MARSIWALGAVLWMTAAMAQAEEFWARDLKGRAGIGVTAPLGAEQGKGVEGIYWFHDHFAVKGNTYYRGFFPGTGDAQKEFDLGLGLIFNTVRANTTNLGVGLGFNLFTLSEGSSATEFNFEIPVRIEQFISRFFAMHVQTGIVFHNIDKKGAVGGRFKSATDSEGKGWTRSSAFEIGGQSQVGFTMYF